MFLCVWATLRGNTSRLQIAYLRVTQRQAGWMQPQLRWDDAGRHLPSLPELLCAHEFLFREGLGKTHQCPRTWLTVPVRIHCLFLYTAKVEHCIRVLQHLTYKKRKVNLEMNYTYVQLHVVYTSGTWSNSLHHSRKFISCSEGALNTGPSLSTLPTPCLVPEHNETKGKISGKTQPI